MGMGSSSSPSPQNAAVTYAPASIAVQNRESEALRRAGEAKPVTYNFDVNKANQMADTLGKYSALHSLNSLKEINPGAYEGEQSAIRAISGGVPGDDAFLRNSALQSGLIATNPSGVAVAGPGSAGGASVANIYGKDLLAYRQQRAAQQLQLASGLTPDTSINPGAGVSAYMGNDQRFADQQNQTQTALANLNLLGPQNENNNLQQNISATQAAYNAQAASDAQANGARQGMLGNILGGVGSVAGGVVGAYGGPGGAALGAGLGGAAGKLGGTAIS